MEIVRVTEATAAQASRIYALSWKTGYRGIVPQPYLDALSEDRWTIRLGKGGTTDLLLLDGGRAVATSTLCAARDEAMPGWGEIVSLYVLPEFFGRGYGKALFAYALQQLRQQGFTRVYLWVLEENTRARAFYRRMGFTPNGDRLELALGGKRLTELRYVGCV